MTFDELINAVWISDDVRYMGFPKSAIEKILRAYGDLITTALNHLAVEVIIPGVGKLTVVFITEQRRVEFTQSSVIRKKLNATQEES